MLGSDLDRIAAALEAIVEQSKSVDCSPCKGVGSIYEINQYGGISEKECPRCKGAGRLRRRNARK